MKPIFTLSDQSRTLSVAVSHDGDVVVVALVGKEISLRYGSSVSSIPAGIYEFAGSVAEQIVILSTLTTVPELVYQAAYHMPERAFQI